VAELLEMNTEGFKTMCKSQASKMVEMKKSIDTLKETENESNKKRQKETRNG
jgi:hypothetical protein